MPGANCAFPQCGTSRRQKYEGVAIFRVTQRKSEFYSRWRENVINIIKKYRDVDEAFAKQIDSWHISTCEAHYAREDIEFTGMLNLAFVVVFLGDLSGILVYGIGLGLNCIRN